ncbi:CpaF family protein [Carboxydothermus ferrireducens]|uniref:Pilus assembly protein CpaF n=1 Tax=Carboxydothermus ferrireducens DSM 11255 TaxID=1119529 RepID=A0ABX2RB96_9THEO|nr:ATPase, T2SS/T4P/T4SS family [Carboxydothermus ferrireducens]NYE57145.1 pilus assembly protein CpaF [Carboxydothermus ferrireducens DSM 11255]
MQSSDFTPQELEMLLREVQRRVLARISDRRDIDVRVAINDIARQVIIDKKPAMLPKALEFAEEAYTRLFSLGPLEKYLQPGSAVTNMIIFGTKLLVEENGEKRIENAFTSEEEVLRIFERIANRVGKELSIAVPSIDAELPDGSRVLLVIPPQGDKPYGSIRRHTKREAKLEELYPGMRGLKENADYLIRAVKGRKNFVVAGSTNAGKTTLMNALLQEVQPKHVVAVLEDTREINLSHLEFVAYFKTREIEGMPPITWQRILKDCLRFTPQRIVLTEVRTPPAAYELIQVLNTGHAGSMTSIHANGAMDALYRLETLIQEHRNLPIEVIRRLIARAVDIAIFLTTVENEIGETIGRKIAEIIEVDRELDENGQYKIREVYRG